MASAVDLLSWFQFVAVSFLSILLLLYFYSKNKHSYWKRKGIDGPPPLPIIGTLLENFTAEKMRCKVANVKKYGKVYGSYMGLIPVLIVADPETIQQICVKDFDIFPNHSMSEDVYPNKYSKSFLIFLKDEHWKKVRAFLSPTFTSTKIRRMFKLLDGCGEDLIKCIKEHISEAGHDGERTVVDIKEIYDLYTMDAITTCCYGLKLERAGSKDLKSIASRDEFVHMAMKAFDQSLWRMAVAMAVPKIILNFINFSTLPTSRMSALAQRVEALVDKRKRNVTKKFDDYLQLLIDARLDAKMELDDNDQAENHHAGLTHDSIVEDQKKLLEKVQSQLTDEQKGTKVTLTEMEILSNAILFLLVGLETTSILLRHCSCILAFHPEIQERLYQELSSCAEYNEDQSKFCFSYESLTFCKYLDAVISETLRFYPSVLETDRMTNSNYKIEKYNIELPAGSRILLSHYAVQNDPDFWDEPEKFDPKRFMSSDIEKLVPGSYNPFGLGPRHCIGMRFSLTESKLALAKLIMNFKFEPAPGVKWPLECEKSYALNNIKDSRVCIIAR